MNAPAQPPVRGIGVTLFLSAPEAKELHELAVLMRNDTDALISRQHFSEAAMVRAHQLAIALGKLAHAIEYEATR